MLAGGSGSRLWPITLATSKQLLPVYDKPLIYYPLATLMLAGIREILIVTTPEHKSAFESLLGDGSDLGISLSFATQAKPNGLAEAFIIGEQFINKDKVSLILGYNIFHGSGLGTQLEGYQDVSGAQIFAYTVTDPIRYGIVEFDSNGVVQSIEEKPKIPKSSYAIPGLYFYDNAVVEVAKNVKPSLRGEVEISSINEHYLSVNKLTANILPRGTVWLDSGTFDSLYAAASYVKVIEERQGQKIACLEEIAWHKGWVSESQMQNLIRKYGSSSYSDYLKMVLERHSLN